MAAFVWTDAWATGNMMIDTQHKELFKAINELLDACSSGYGQEKISITMQFLIDYTAKHFGEEEALQQKTKYPDYPNHKILHDNFKKTVADLSAQLRKDGPTIALVTKVSASTGNWLIAHIETQDRKVAAHVKSVGEH